MTPDLTPAQNLSEATLHADAVVDRLLIAVRSLDPDAEQVSSGRIPPEDRDARRRFRFARFHLLKGRRPTLRTAVDIAHGMRLPLNVVLREPRDIALDAMEIARVQLHEDDPELIITGDLAEERVVDAITRARAARGLGCPTLAKDAGVDRWWLHRINGRQRNGLQLTETIAVLRRLGLDLRAVILTEPSVRELAAG